MANKQNQEHQPNNLQQPRVRCPKGMKMPKSVKTYAALGKFASKSDHNSYMRSTGMAIHDVAHRPTRSFATKTVSDASARAIAGTDAAQ